VWPFDEAVSKGRGYRQEMTHRFFADVKERVSTENSIEEGRFAYICTTWQVGGEYV